MAGVFRRPFVFRWEFVVAAISQLRGSIQFLRTTQFASRYSVVQPAVASCAAVGESVGRYAQ